MAIASAVNALAVVVLVCVTSWYASSTKKILAESRKTREAAEKQATTAQNTLEILQRNLEEQSGLGRIALKHELARAISLIVYWQERPVTELVRASSLPETSDLIPANLSNILDQARRVSFVVGETTSAAFHKLLLAKTEVERLKNADASRISGNPYDSAPSKANVYFAEALRKFQEIQKAIE